MENTEENCEKIPKIWKKSKLYSEMIWKIWKKGKLNRYGKYGRKDGKDMKNTKKIVKR